MTSSLPDPVDRRLGLRLLDGLTGRVFDGPAGGGLFGRGGRLVLTVAPAATTALLVVTLPARRTDHAFSVT
jgi:hypothetical protein